MEPLCAGVDGARGGWAAALGRPGGPVQLLLISSLSDLPLGELEAAAVDVPIGLPESGPRACDQEARAILSHRPSSVFPAPSSFLVREGPWSSHRQACDASRRRTGKGLSLQTWHIIPKIREADEWLLSLDPDSRRRVLETHPEVVFYRLAGRPLGSKKTQEGRQERLDVLRPECRAAFERGPEPLPGVKAHRDDLLDSLAALEAAWKWASGRGSQIPLAPLLDAKGLPMRIIF